MKIMKMNLLSTRDFLCCIASVLTLKRTNRLDLKTSLPRAVAVSLTLTQPLDFISHNQSKVTDKTSLREAGNSSPSKISVAPYTNFSTPTRFQNEP